MMKTNWGSGAGGGGGGGIDGLPRAHRDETEFRFYIQISKPLASLYYWAGRLESYLIATPDNMACGQ